MTWTTTKPAQAGWYWVKTNALNPQIVQICIYENGRNTINPALVAVGYDLTGGEMWSGPLDPPM